MKKLFVLTISLLFVFGFANIPTPGLAALLDIYVDSAPDVLRSPDYNAWESNAFSAAADGTFVNMANGINPSNVGSTNFEIQDEVTYNFGDFGKRITWVYYVPDETVASLDTRFQVSLVNKWNGDVLDYYKDEFGATWLQPTQWVDYDADGDNVIDGVVGAAGVAWAGAPNTDSQAELDADMAEWSLSDESWTFTAQLDGKKYKLQATREAVPIPGAIILLGSGLIGLVGLRRKNAK